MVQAIQTPTKATDEVFDRAAAILGSPQSVIAFDIQGSQESTLLTELSVRVSTRFRECKSAGMAYPEGSGQADVRRLAEEKAARLAAIYSAPLGATGMIQQGGERVPSPFPGFGLDVEDSEILEVLTAGDRRLPVMYPVFSYDCGGGLRRAVMVSGRIRMMGALDLVSRYNRLKEQNTEVAGQSGLDDSSRNEMVELLKAEMKIALNALISLDVLAWADTRAEPGKQFINFLDWLIEDGRANNGIYVLLDPQSTTAGSGAFPEIQRRVKNISQDLPSRSYKKLVLAGAGELLPDSYTSFIHQLSLPVPEQEEIREIISKSLEGFRVTIEENNARQPVASQREWVDELGEGGLGDLVRASQGLTREQITQVLCESVLGEAVGKAGQAVVIGRSLIDRVRDAKIEQLKRLGVEFANAPDVSVGGLNNLKSWAERRRKMFWLVEDKNSPEYQAIAHLNPKPPSGLLVTGISGTGKSLIAKTIGRDWNVPILTLDIGTLFGSYVGESEERTRSLIRAVEACAPCILYIDEIDKALASAGQDTKGDSGVSDRMLGTLLTWMQEKTSNVFVIASANDMEMIQAKKPEFLRKGRFDEKFFVDLPTTSERIEIFQAHLAGKGEFSQSDLEALAEASDGLVGAEIGAAVADSIFRAIDANRSYLILEDVEAECRSIRPLSKADPGMVSRLREWGYRHAVPAGQTVLRDSLSSHPENNGGKRRGSSSRLTGGDEGGAIL